MVIFAVLTVFQLFLLSFDWFFFVFDDRQKQSKNSRKSQNSKK